MTGEINELRERVAELEKELKAESNSNAALYAKLHSAEQRVKDLEKELSRELSEHKNTCLSFTKAIEFASENETDGGMDFLRCWLEGDWDSCREWADEFDLHEAIFYPEQEQLRAKLDKGE